MEYRDYLKKTQSAITNDQRDFRRWELRKISTLQAFNCYLANNRIPQGTVKYDRDLFAYWLESLGYKRPDLWQEDRETVRA